MIEVGERKKDIVKNRESFKYPHIAQKYSNRGKCMDLGKIFRAGDKGNGLSNVFTCK